MTGSKKDLLSLYPAIHLHHFLVHQGVMEWMIAVIYKGHLSLLIGLLSKVSQDV